MEKESIRKINYLTTPKQFTTSEENTNKYLNSFQKFETDFNKKASLKNCQYSSKKLSDACHLLNTSRSKYSKKNDDNVNVVINFELQKKNSGLNAYYTETDLLKRKIFNHENERLKVNKSKNTFSKYDMIFNENEVNDYTLSVNKKIRQKKKKKYGQMGVHKDLEQLFISTNSDFKTFCQEDDIFKDLDKYCEGSGALNEDTDNLAIIDGGLRFIKSQNKKLSLLSNKRSGLPYREYLASECLDGNIDLSDDIQRDCSLEHELRQSIKRKIVLNNTGNNVSNSDFVRVNTRDKTRHKKRTKMKDQILNNSIFSGDEKYIHPTYKTIIDTEMTMPPNFHCKKSFKDLSFHTINENPVKLKKKVDKPNEFSDKNNFSVTKLCPTPPNSRFDFCRKTADNLYLEDIHNETLMSNLCYDSPPLSANLCLNDNGINIFSNYANSLDIDRAPHSCDVVSSSRCSNYKSKQNTHSKMEKSKIHHFSSIYYLKQYGNQCFGSRKELHDIYNPLPKRQPKRKIKHNHTLKYYKLLDRPKKNIQNEIKQNRKEDYKTQLDYTENLKIANVLMDQNLCDQVSESNDNSSNTITDSIDSEADNSFEIQYNKYTGTFELCNELNSAYEGLKLCRNNDVTVKLSIPNIYVVKLENNDRSNAADQSKFNLNLFHGSQKQLPKTGRCQSLEKSLLDMGINSKKSKNCSMSLEIIFPVKSRRNNYLSESSCRDQSTHKTTHKVRPCKSESGLNVSFYDLKEMISADNTEKDPYEPKSSTTEQSLNSCIQPTTTTGSFLQTFDLEILKSKKFREEVENIIESYLKNKLNLKLAGSDDSSFGLMLIHTDERLVDQVQIPHNSTDLKTLKDKKPGKIKGFKINQHRRIGSCKSLLKKKSLTKCKKMYLEAIDRNQYYYNEIKKLICNLSHQISESSTTYDIINRLSKINTIQSLPVLPIRKLPNNIRNISFSADFHEYSLQNKHNKNQLANETTKKTPKKIKNKNEKNISKQKMKPKKYKPSKIFDELEKFKQVLSEVEEKQETILQTLQNDPCGLLFHFSNKSVKDPQDY